MLTILFVQTLRDKKKAPDNKLHGHCCFGKKNVIFHEDITFEVTMRTCV